VKFGGAKDDQALANAESIARVRGALSGYRASHGKDAMVSVAHVLDLLNPRGLWSLDPQRGKDQPPEPQQLPPGADPITGCMPVTPA
jgi:hypothetical protein